MTIETAKAIASILYIAYKFKLLSYDTYDKYIDVLTVKALQHSLDSQQDSDAKDSCDERGR